MSGAGVEVLKNVLVSLLVSLAGGILVKAVTRPGRPWWFYLLVAAGLFGLALVVSVFSWPPLVEVRAVEGLSRDEAEARLRKARLAASWTYVLGPEGPRWIVVAQEPRPGTKVARRSLVEVKVALGRLIGVNVEEALEVARRAGLQPVVEEGAGGDGCARAGQVYGHTPAEDHVLRPGERVILCVKL